MTLSKTFNFTGLNLKQAAVCSQFLILSLLLQKHLKMSLLPVRFHKYASSYPRCLYFFVDISRASSTRF